MNSLDIILFVLPFAAIYAGYRWGFEVGYDRGNVDGRQAIRNSYTRVIK
jgi:hypothetical protein